MRSWKLDIFRSLLISVSSCFCSSLYLYVCIFGYVYNTRTIERTVDCGRKTSMMGFEEFDGTSVSYLNKKRTDHFHVMIRGGSGGAVRGFVWKKEEEL